LRVEGEARLEALNSALRSGAWGASKMGTRQLRSAAWYHGSPPNAPSRKSKGARAVRGGLAQRASREEGAEASEGRLSRCCEQRQQ
jgi:hypothetical protein